MFENLQMSYFNSINKFKLLIMEPKSNFATAVNFNSLPNIAIAIFTQILMVKLNFLSLVKIGYI